MTAVSSELPQFSCYGSLRKETLQLKMVRFLLPISLFICVGFCSGNEDVLRSLASGHYGPPDIHVAKRTAARNTDYRVIKQSAGFRDLVDTFASRIGRLQKLDGDFGLVKGDWRSESIGDLRPKNSRPSIQISQGENEKTKIVKTVNRDFVFVLDTSASISDTEFEQAKESIAFLVEYFCPAKLGSDVMGSGTKQVSVVLFGSRVTKVIDFEDSHKGLSYLQKQIIDIQHKREDTTSTANALKYVKEAILGEGASRLNNPKVSTDVIIITDGQCNNECADLGKEADAIRAMGQGVNVIAVGVAGARESELDIISGEVPQSSFELYGMKDFKKLAEGIKCKASQSVDKCV